jgi:hypothetical protein
MFCLPLSAELFVVTVPPLPDKSTQEMYEEEDLFAITVLNYYAVATGIETLIKIHGLSPVKIVPVPTLEELEDADFKTIIKYYSICNSLKNQYDNNQLNYRDVEIEKLLKQVRECQKYNLQLQSENRALSIINDKIAFYRDNNYELIDDLAGKQFVIDSLYWAVYKSKDEVYTEMQANMQKNRRNLYPVISLHGGVIKPYMYSNNVVEENGFSGQLIFNPGPIINVGRYFDVRGGFTHYAVVVGGQRSYCSNYEYSLDLILPLHDIFKMESLSLEMKLGLGFFNAQNYSPNSVFNDADWHGELMRLELDAFNFGCEFPVGLFVSYTFYHNSKAPVFTDLTGRRIGLGENWNNGLSIGLSFALWNKLY